MSRRTYKQIATWLFATVCAWALLAGSAHAVHGPDIHFGDGYGPAPINDAEGALDTNVPGLPGIDRAFWAGACDRAALPGFGEAIEGPDAAGARPSTFEAPESVGGSPTYVERPTPSVERHCLDWGTMGPYTLPGAPIWRTPPAWRAGALTQAGAHPDGTSMLMLARQKGGLGSEGRVDGATDNIYVDLPAGFAGDPTAVPKCTAEQFAVEPPQCGPETQVGTLNLVLAAIGVAQNPNLSEAEDEILPVYNLEPRRGNVAELGFAYASAEDATSVRLVAKVRTEDDFGVTAYAAQIPAVLPLLGQSITLWGVPWAAANDIWRAPAATRKIPAHGLDGSVQSGGLVRDPVPYDPAWGPIRPFLSNPTECSGKALVTTLSTDSYQDQGTFTESGFPDPADETWERASSPAPALSGCEALEFDPSLQARPTTNRADSPSGLEVDLTIPQNNDAPPALANDPGSASDLAAGAPGHWRSDSGIATAHLKKTTVTLPEGLVLNPSSANGLAACSSHQIGLTTTNGAVPRPIRFDGSDPSDGKGRECPQASKIAEVEIETPALSPSDQPTGEVYIARPFDNPFDSLLALYITVRSPERGFMAKLAGEVTADPDTGQLTTTFDHNPQLPFEEFSLKFKAGAHAPLITPSVCGTRTPVSDLTSWARPGQNVTSTDSWSLTQGPGGRSCKTSEGSLPHAPSFQAGTARPIAGVHSPFALRLRRDDGTQRFGSLTVNLPAGLTAKLAGTPYCSESAIAGAKRRSGRAERSSPSCPAASKVGRVEAAAGAGPSPYWAPGNAYLSGPYKGAPLSMAIITPAVAGPFDLGTVVVRTALHVDDRTAQVTAVSDEIPRILEGIPLNVREVKVRLDKPGFTLNPTSCDPMAVTGKVTSTLNRTASVQSRFQVGECARLGFAPRFGMFNLGKGRRSTLRSFNPPMRFTLLPRAGDANVGPTQVTLPSSIILDQSNLDTICTRDQFASRDCPEGSVVGFARATSPLLDEPVQGPVYLGSSTNPLPDLIADLQGQVGVVLQGQVDSARGGRIRNTFNVVPDVPVSRFDLNMFGGKNTGILVNSQDLCRSRERGVARFQAQNGRVSVQRPPIRTAFRGCKRVIKQEARQKQIRRTKVIRAYRQGRISRAQAKRILQRMKSARMSGAEARRAVRR